MGLAGYPATNCTNVKAFRKRIKADWDLHEWRSAAALASPARDRIVHLALARQQLDGDVGEGSAAVIGGDVTYILPAGCLPGYVFAQQFRARPP